MSLLNEAIADARAVQKAAIANAKTILEESFEAPLRRMISSKLAEEAEDEVLENDDIMSDETVTENEFEDTEFEDTDDLELESILRELDGEEEDPLAAPAPVAPVAPAAPVAAAPVDPLAADYGTDDVAVTDDELDEILREMEDEEMAEDEPEMAESYKLRKENRNLKSDLHKTNLKLAEAIKAIKILRTGLTETTLLNTKLVYYTNLNRKFKLSENQQTKMLSAFDRASTIKEAKLIYTTLTESYKETTGLKALKENASASRTITKTTQPIVAGNRLQKLAGII